MIRRPLFLGTLGFCGAILIAYFLGKAVALGMLVFLALAWHQARSKAKSRMRSAKWSASEGQSDSQYSKHVKADCSAQRNGLTDCESRSGNIDGSVCQSEVDDKTRLLHLQRLRLRNHGAAILLIFYAVSFANFQLYNLQRDPFAELERMTAANQDAGSYEKPASNRVAGKSAEMRTSPASSDQSAENGEKSLTATITGTVLNSSIRTASSGDEYLQMTVQVERIGKQEVSRKWYERPVKLLVRQYPSKGKSGVGSQENSTDRSDSGTDPSTGSDSPSLIPVSPGTQLSITGEVEMPSSRRNPNCFDYQLYLKTIGIDRIMTVQAMDIKDESHSLQGWLFCQKEKYLTRLKESAGESAAGLMRGILFGEKTEIGEDTLEEFQRNGTAHILAVSGLHIGIMYGVSGKLWRGKKGWLYFWMVTLVLLGYSFLASFSPSVIRASVMIVLHLYAKVRHLRYDLGSASFVVLLLILLNNPMQLFHTGLQMSFLAVLTLSSAAPFFQKFYQGIFLSSGVVQLGLLPYTAYVFNYMSLAAVFVNVPIILLAGFLVPLGIGGFAVDLLMSQMVVLPGADLFSDVIFQPLFDLLGQVIGGLCQLLTTCNGMTCIKGVTSFEVTSPPRSLLAGYYLLLLLFLSEEGRLLILRKRKKLVAALVCLCLGASAVFGQATATGFEKSSIIFVDVGQGDCMHIKTEDGKNYLVDGGGKIDYNLGKKTLKPYLLKNGVRRLDGVFVTHLHTDHYKGITELCQEGMVKRLFLYEGNRDKTEQICRETGMSADDLVFLHAGQIVSLSESASAKKNADASDFAGEYVEVLWPEADAASNAFRRSGVPAASLQKKTQASEEEDENETSLIMKIHAGGMGMLATGDVDAICEDRLAAKYRAKLKTDLLKVAHHGSRYSWSDSFAKYTEPQAAVFQVGKNNYGHPNGEIIAGYKQLGAGIWRNDLQGAVGFYCRGGVDHVTGKKRLEVVTMMP